jgi:GTPase
VQITYHEVPHALSVMVDKFEETPKILRIEATLYVERDSQKKILVGRKADMLKKIGTEARKELETLLGTKIYLGLFVKVAPDWRENPEKVREISWHTQLEGLVQGAAPEEFDLEQSPHEDAGDVGDEEPDADPKA